MLYTSLAVMELGIGGIVALGATTLVVCGRKSKISYDVVATGILSTFQYDEERTEGSRMPVTRIRFATGNFITVDGRVEIPRVCRPMTQIEIRRRGEKYEVRPVRV